MNRPQRGTIVGMALGDGHIRTASAKDKLAGRRIAAQLSFSHSMDQREYAQWKVDRLNQIFGGNASLGVTVSNGYPSCHANKSNPYLKTLKGMLYKDGKKRITRQILDMLTPEGIAIWFMDDGSYRINKRSDGTVSSVSLTITTCCSLKEVKTIIGYFKDKYGIEFKRAYVKKNDLWYVRANTESSRKFTKLIQKYVIPSMQYKLSCVQLLDRHERHAPSQTCESCHKPFAALKAKGLCMNCYNTQHFKTLKGKSRTCEICGETKSARWFVGDRCRPCYVKEGKRQRV